MLKYKSEVIQVLKEKKHYKSISLAYKWDVLLPFNKTLRVCLYSCSSEPSTIQ